MLHNATADTFAQDVLQSDLPVLVDFWAEWCQPCRTMLPVLEQIAAEYEGRLRVVKVDADAQATLAAKYGVRGLPTLMVFHEGELQGLRTGAMPKSAVEALVAGVIER